MLILLILYIVVGSILSAMSVPLILGKIPPNALYGFRVPKTLENVSLWYAVNAFAAKGLLSIGIGLIVLAIVTYLIPGINVEAYALVCAGFILPALVLNVLLSLRYLSRLSKREEMSQELGKGP